MVKTIRSKYNVDLKNKSKRTYNGIVFDSVLEMKYYRDVVQPKVESGQIIKCELQKSYELQPGFVKNGRKVKAITYVADFYLEYADGTSVIIDTKGNPDNVAKMKRKMFWFKYPHANYQWITYSKIDGGWVSYELVKKARAARKKQRRAKSEQ